MNGTPRPLWIVTAFVLTLMLCMLVAVSSIVFASPSETLYRREGCFSYRQGIWYYGEATGTYYPDYHSMSQKERNAHYLICIQLT